MGFVHHSNYVKYYENARWESLRAIGINYCEIEKQGYFMPVISMNFEFIKPSFFDDELTIYTIIKDIPRARVRFDYEMYNQGNELINKACTILAFIDKENKKACLPPVFFQKQLIEML